MKIIQIIKIAVKNIFSNKLRSLLTMLGLIIGISSVIVLVGISDGSNKKVNEQVQGLGTDILNMNISSKDYGLKYEKLDDIYEIENIKNIAPFKNIYKSVKKDNENFSMANIVATNENYIDVQNLQMDKGRLVSIIDIENKSKVCVIGAEVAKKLFGLSNPIKQQIKIDGDNYTVIGLLKKQGNKMGNNSDNLVLIPFTTAKYLEEDTNITQMYIKIKNSDDIEKTKQELVEYIRSNFQISTEHFSISSQDSMLDAMDDIDNTLTMLLAGVASISLIVGGIGVMNVMLVSVTERIKEIGIRKSLGAKKIDILVQFLVEALVLSFAGGILGVLIGIGLGNLLENVGFVFLLNINIIGISVIVSILIGLIFGIFPAYRAASLNPIEALRHD